MTHPSFDRRRFIAASAAVLGSGAAPAAQEPGLFDNTALAQNRLAKGFHPAPAGLAFPRATLLGRDGVHRPREWRGKVHIVSLWAEWCIPCLAEAPELAGLEHRHAGQNLAMLSVLTSSHKKLDWAGAAAVLTKAKAESLPLLIEPDGGEVLANSVGLRNGQPSLPCNLLVDAKGRIRGRNFGAGPADPEAQKRVMATIKFGPGGRIEHDDLERLFAASKGTVWSTPDADAFVDALAKGALDHV